MDVSAPDSRSRPELVLIAAIARNGVIGARGALPWRISGDLKRFKAETLDKPVIMGRKTFESIGGPLPGRDTIVLTRRVDDASQGVFRALTPQAALDCALDCARKRCASRIMIAGGAEIYALFLHEADRMLLTHVDLEAAGDAYFPSFDPVAWRVEMREEFPRGAKDDAAYVITNYRRTTLASI